MSLPRRYLSSYETAYNDEPWVQLAIRAGFKPAETEAAARAMARYAAREIAELREALERIANLTAGGPHVDATDGMSAALASLDRARDIARAALPNPAPPRE